MDNKKTFGAYILQRRKELGMTVGELLGDGEEAPAAAEPMVAAALDYADTARQYRSKFLRRLSALILSGLFLAGIITCSIVDLALNGGFTWSIIPICSILFAWLVALPAVLLEKQGVLCSLTAATLLTAPFLYTLHLILNDGGSVLSIGLFTSGASLVYLWAAFLLLGRMRNKWTAAALLVLLAIPLNLVINLYLSGRIGEPLMDVWDMMDFAIMLAASAALYGVGRLRRDKRN